MLTTKDILESIQLLKRQGKSLKNWKIYMCIKCGRMEKQLRTPEYWQQYYDAMKLQLVSMPNAKRQLSFDR